MDLDSLLSESERELAMLNAENEHIGREASKFSKHFSVEPAQGSVPSSGSQHLPENQEAPDRDLTPSTTPAEDPAPLAPPAPPAPPTSAQSSETLPPPTYTESPSAMPPRRGTVAVSRRRTRARRPSTDTSDSADSTDSTAISASATAPATAPFPSFTAPKHRRSPEAPSFSQVLNAVLEAHRRVLSMLLVVLSKVPTVLLWIVFASACVVPSALVLLAALSFFYYGLRGAEFLKQRVCSFEPMRYSLDRSGLDWCVRPPSSPQVTLQGDPWAKEALSGLYTNLPALYRVESVFYDLRETHLRRLRVDIDMLHKKNALIRGKDMAQALTAINAALIAGSNASRQFVLNNDVLMTKTRNEMGQYRESLLFQLDIDSPGARGRLATLIHNLMSLVPFLAKLDATNSLITAISHVAYTIASEVGNILPMAKRAFEEIDMIQIQLDTFDWHVAQETDGFETDCNVHFWRNKPLKCASLSLYEHRKKMKQFGTEIEFFKENLENVTLRLQAIRDSCDKSANLAMEITTSERWAWQINDVLAHTKGLIDESGKFIARVEGKQAEFNRQVDLMKAERYQV